jgi:hypothetical protein
MAGATLTSCDVFSSSVMREIKSRTLFSVGTDTSRYTGEGLAADAICAWTVVAASRAAARVTRNRIVLRSAKTT